MKVSPEASGGPAGASRTTRRRRFTVPINGKAAWAGLAVLLIILTAVALAGPISRADPLEIDLESALSPPSLEHPFGTDAFGRDVLARVLSGGRVSLVIGFTARTISLLLGLVAGTLAGYRGGKTDSVIMRLADITFAFPTLLLLIAIMAVLDPGIAALCAALGFVGWAAMARLVRSQVISLRDRDYVQAARAAGAGEMKIVFRYILPQCLSPLIVVFTIGLGMTVMAESSLSFLGLGVRPPEPSWGGMISKGIPFMRTAPWLTMIPGLVLTLTVCSLNLVGDGLRDALDPRSSVGSGAITVGGEGVRGRAGEKAGAR